MKTTIVILGIAAAVLVTGFMSTQAYACQGQKSQWKGQGSGPSKPGPGHHGGLSRLDHMMRMLGKLDLTPKQSDEVHKLFKSNAGEFVDVAWTIAQTKRELKEAMHGADGDEKAVRDAADRMGKTITKAAVLKFNFRKDVMAVLTPEQQEKCKEMMHSKKMMQDSTPGHGMTKPPGGKCCDKMGDKPEGHTQDEQD